MERLCDCVRRAGERAFVLRRKINSEVSGREMAPRRCRSPCSQEKAAAAAEPQVSLWSPGRGAGTGAGTSGALCGAPTSIHCCRLLRSFLIGCSSSGQQSLPGKLPEVSCVGLSASSMRRVDRKAFSLWEWLSVTVCHPQPKGDKFPKKRTFSPRFVPVSDL